MVVVSQFTTYAIRQKDSLLSSVFSTLQSPQHECPVSVISTVSNVAVMVIKV